MNINIINNESDNDEINIKYKTNDSNDEDDLNTSKETNDSKMI